MAEINGQPIFESEVVPEADRQLADLPGAAPADKLRMRPEYIRRQLARVADRKLLSQEARRIGPQINQASFQSAGSDEEALAAALLTAVVRVDTNITREQLWACYRLNQGNTIARRKCDSSKCPLGWPAFHRATLLWPR